jgi:hypothetical protein
MLKSPLGQQSPSSKAEEVVLRPMKSILRQWAEIDIVLANFELPNVP